MANLLVQYPANPTILDDWELSNIYDQELSASLGCTLTRAREVRSAFDAMWETMNDAELSQHRVTPEEKRGFEIFHSIKTNLYSCVLPGEVIQKCVHSIQMGEFSPNELLAARHLIVDEYQDLNVCDQEFIRLICRDGVSLFVAGDDDQSIYTSLRHANPDGIVRLQDTYPEAVTHELTACFRCAPNILDPAMQLISQNPNRQTKQLRALYEQAAPPVSGTMKVWSFSDADTEARAVANSCAELLANGMDGREDEIVILLSARNPPAVQLAPITRELGNLGIPFAVPRGADQATDPAVRCIYALLRIVNEENSDQPDYPAHRTILGVMTGVGRETIRGITDGCIDHNLNFRELFHQEQAQEWMDRRASNSMNRARSLIDAACQWNMDDTLEGRSELIAELLREHIFNSNRSSEQIDVWRSFTSNLPADMMLSELLEYLAARTEAEQEQIVKRVSERIGVTEEELEPASKAVRILTMHGAKGLNGKIVFIPFAEEGIIPSFRAIRAAGLVIESRRLFYVSVTRSMAACIISHSALHTGAAAYALQQKANVRLPRSQYLNEMGVRSDNRDSGLTAVEARQIVQEVNNL